jgi:hypothetical protein
MSKSNYATFCTRVYNIHTLSSSHLLFKFSHFVSHPWRLKQLWNILKSKIWSSSSCLSNFGEIKSYVFNFNWDFFFLTIYVDLGFLILSICLCFLILSSSGYIFFKSKLQTIGFVTVYIFLFIYLFISNRIKPSNNQFKPQTRIRANRSPFFGRIESYFLTLWFELGDNFRPESTQTRPLSSPLFQYNSFRLSFNFLWYHDF